MIDCYFFYEMEEILIVFEKYEIDFIVLVGFLWFIFIYLVEFFMKCMVNIYFVLLFKFGGKGMYGKYVYWVVKEVGEKESGIMIYFVNENYDEGDIIF